MDISLFDYPYPPDLVAQHPLTERDASRLLVLDRKAGTWQHRLFKDFPDYFSKEDTLVFNDTKVFPARLYGTAAPGRTVEVLLLQPESPLPLGERARERGGVAWPCLVRPAKKIKPSEKITFAPDVAAILQGQRDTWTLEFLEPIPAPERLFELGLPPLPPYIKRPCPCHPEEQSDEGSHGSPEILHGACPERSRRVQDDRQRYQTIYAEKIGSAAAPTAGFHFTPETLQTLKQKGCTLCYGTLHIGRDTFEPVRVQDITQHHMHGEAYEIPEATAQQVIKSKGEGAKVTAIGTTTVRALESAWNGEGLRWGAGHTEAFFYPGYQFQVVDQLLTNFHQPKSTLLMLVAAFAGREPILAAYQDAIRQKYRLFSYGDAMLIL